LDKLKRIWGYFRPHKINLILSIIFSLVVAGTTGATAYIIKPALDGIFINQDKEKLSIIPLIIILLYTLKGISRFFQNFLLRKTGQKVIQTIRNELLEKIIILPMKFFSKNSTGMLMSRITNDIYVIQDAIPSAISLFRESITIIVLAGVVLNQELILGSIALFVVPLLIYPIVYLGKKVKKYSKRGQEKMGDISSLLQEIFSGIKVVKAFTNEEKEKEKFKKVNDKFVNDQIKMIIYDEISSPLLEFFGALGIAFIVYYGGQQVLNGSTTPGTFFSFLAALALMYEPFKRLNRANSKVQAAIGAAERVFGLMDINNEILEKDGYLECKAQGKEITFKNVYFKYEDDEDFILKEINLNLKPGTTVALVGSSGAGKSTLVNLLPRFYDITDGSICIGGTDIRNFKIHSLRRNIGIVSQEPFLFNDSIKNNIAYGLDNVLEEDIIMAAKAAYAHDFILDLPYGYNTFIGERGVRLSGGQRQRITIARALLKNPPILILDEATSALDTESEKIVQKALENLMKGRTSFVIAHRLSTILNADMIVVLKNGKIEATGKHKDLISISSTYKTLYDMQFKNG
jgi:subfamily B ATP-binding cassette protein MsbA